MNLYHNTQFKWNRILLTGEIKYQQSGNSNNNFDLSRRNSMSYISGSIDNNYTQA